MQLFYHPALTATDKEIRFDKDESRHIQKVLRKKVGDIIYTTNGQGGRFKLQLSLVTPKHCEAQVVSYQLTENLPYRLHLAVAPTKNNDRFEWFLEKATEIGVTQITPLLCDHSERKHIKLDRFEKIIVSAAKQSLKDYVPKLNPLTKFEDFIAKASVLDSLKCIAHCEDAPKNALKDSIENNDEIIILIGPEGDFSSQEIESAKLRGFIAVSLGNERLRTETAAIAACHTVSLFLSD